MTSVYNELLQQIDEEESYAGEDVLATIMQTIKTTTLSLIQNEDETAVAEEQNTDTETHPGEPDAHEFQAEEEAQGSDAEVRAVDVEREDEQQLKSEGSDTDQ